MVWRECEIHFVPFLLFQNHCRIIFFCHFLSSFKFLHQTIFNTKKPSSNLSSANHKLISKFATEANVVCFWHLMTLQNFHASWKRQQKKIISLKASLPNYATKYFRSLLFSLKKLDNILNRKVTIQWLWYFTNMVGDEHDVRCY